LSIGLQVESQSSHKGDIQKVCYQDDDLFPNQSGKHKSLECLALDILPTLACCPPPRHSLFPHIVPNARESVGTFHRFASSVFHIFHPLCSFTSSTGLHLATRLQTLGMDAWEHLAEQTRLRMKRFKGSFSILSPTPTNPVLCLSHPIALGEYASDSEDTQGRLQSDFLINLSPLPTQSLGDDDDSILDLEKYHTAPNKRLLQ
jgi:hypothetical protein